LVTKRVVRKSQPATFVPKRRSPAFRARSTNNDWTTSSANWEIANLAAGRGINPVQMAPNQSSERVFRAENAIFLQQFPVIQRADFHRHICVYICPPRGKEDKKEPPPRSTYKSCVAGATQDLYVLPARARLPLTRTAGKNLNGKWHDSFGSFWARFCFYLAAPNRGRNQLHLQR
jgi:hypothetical protein